MTMSAAQYFDLCSVQREEAQRFLRLIEEHGFRLASGDPGCAMIDATRELTAHLHRTVREKTQILNEASSRAA